MCIRIVKTLWKGFFKTLKSNFAKNPSSNGPIHILWRWILIFHRTKPETVYTLQWQKAFEACFWLRNRGHKIKIYFWDRGYFMTLNQEAEGIWIWHQCHLKLDRVTKDRKEDRFQCDLISFYRTRPILKKRKLNWQPPEVVNCCHLNITWICLIYPDERYLMARSKG